MLIGISEVAPMLGVCERTARRWADAGIIPSVRTGKGWRLFEQDEIEEWLRKREEDAPEHY